MGCGLCLAACATAPELPDLDSAAALGQVERLPPSARSRVAELRRQLDDDPAVAATWRLLGETLHANGEPGLAAEAYRAALDLGAPETEIRYLRSHALRRAGRPAEALDELARCLASGAEYGPARRTLALWALESGELELARQAATAAARAAPDDPGVRAVRGQIELAAGDPAAALEALLGGSADGVSRAYLDFLASRARQALNGELAAVDPVPEPRWADPLLETLAHQRRGLDEDLATAQAALTAGDPRRAIEILERARSWQPDHATVVQVLALAYRQAGDHATALAILEQAVMDQPAVAEHLIQLAATRLVAAIETRDPELLQGALSAARTLQERWPDDFRSHAVAGDVLNGAGEGEAALEAYLACAALARRSIALCEVKASRLLLGFGRRREVIDLIEGTFGAAPGDREAAALLAAAHQSGGEGGS